ncbi:MAG: M24 family metallopeptidase [Acidobacteriales bacterium]|nr:M24 family metallopeptidase [Terriglobales bacterium]
MNLAQLQAVLLERKIDAWLFYDHHHRDPIAYRILGLPESLHVTRRWYCLVPAKGEPKKLVHRIESHHLDSLPGSSDAYSTWQEQQEKVKNLVSGFKNVAMQYSPMNGIPYIGLVDAGTVELVRSAGVNVVSSGDLVATFEAVLTEEQIRTHFEARDAIDPVMQAAFKEIGRLCSGHGTTHEWEIAKFIMNAFEKANLTSDSTPIVAVNAHASDPHYAPSAEVHSPIKKGDFVLLDMWGKKIKPGAVFYDITWTGVVGRAPSDREIDVFSLVRKARDTGVTHINQALSTRGKMCGWEVDQAVRDVINDAGYGKYFIHRTGHSIGVDIHSNGANMDNFETKDEREILNNTLFSIEPGVYLPEFGVRSEYDVLVRNGAAEATGRIQEQLLVI